MKHLLLASLFLIGCGGGESSLPKTVTETVIETVVEQVPIIERECAEPETIYVVEELIKEVIKEVYVYPEPVIPYVMSRIELDEDGDGTIDRLYIDRNITDGLVIEEYVNTGTSVSQNSWTYNEVGYPITYVTYYNGVLSGTRTWEYDEYNNVVRQTELNEPAKSWFYEYINNEIVSIYSDYEDDGIYDSAIFYSYDDNGNRLTITYDRENDGVVDEIRHNTWVEGRQASVTLPN